MNSNSRANTWKSIKAQYVAAACGLALALAALTGISAWRDGGAAARSKPALGSTSVGQSEQAPQQLVVFIAGSQQQASDHAAQLYQDLNPAWFASYSYLVVTNPDEEAKALAFIGGAAMELVDACTGFDVVDLRSE